MTAEPLTGAHLIADVVLVWREPCLGAIDEQRIDAQRVAAAGGDAGADRDR